MLVRILSAGKIGRKMAGRRIFIAIDISDAAQAACAAHIERLRRQSPKVRVGWERTEKLHITLKFLGDTADDRVEDVVHSVARIATEHRAFELAIAGPGVFPGSSRPRILWIGVHDPSDAVSKLNRDVEDACERLWFEKEGRRFHPHITIGRVREPQNGIPLAKSHLETLIEPIEFAVNSVAVYESKLLPSGSVYSVVQRVTLKV